MSHIRPFISDSYSHASQNRIQPTSFQSQLEGTENRITVERGRFNEGVQTYNTKIKSIPAVFYTAALGFKERPYFQAKEGAEEPPKVDFNFSGAKPAQP